MCNFCVFMTRHSQRIQGLKSQVFWFPQNSWKNDCRTCKVATKDTTVKLEAFDKLIQPCWQLKASIKKSRYILWI